MNTQAGSKDIKIQAVLFNHLAEVTFMTGRGKVKRKMLVTVLYPLTWVKRRSDRRETSSMPP
jgi:hypothetical protein